MASSHDLREVRPPFPHDREHLYGHLDGSISERLVGQQKRVVPFRFLARRVGVTGRSKDNGRLRAADRRITWTESFMRRNGASRRGTTSTLRSSLAAREFQTRPASRKGHVSGDSRRFPEQNNSRGRARGGLPHSRNSPMPLLWRFVRC